MTTHHDARAQLRNRLDEEVGTIFREAARRLVLCYPSPYHVGMSSLGFQTMYGLLNREPDWAAERAFLPDDVEDWRRSRLPLLTYESEQPVGAFEVIAFSVAYELEVPGLFDCLELSGLPLFADERGPQHPLIVAGGPL